MLFFEEKNYFLSPIIKSYLPKMKTK